jgi:hypothetical protein
MMYYTILQKNQNEIVCIPAYIWDILRFLNLFTTSDLKICHFYTAQNTQCFVLIFFAHNWSPLLYTPENIFSIFLKLQISDFQKVWKRASMEPVLQIT